MRQGTEKVLCAVILLVIFSLIDEGEISFPLALLVFVKPLKPI